MPREVTIALVQMMPELANPEANLRKMGDFIEKICSEQKTDLIIFPELIAFPVSPPWAVEPALAADPDASAPLVVSPAHLRMRVHYCEQCTYAELHYIRDDA